MIKKLPGRKKETSLRVDKNYVDFLKDIKNRLSATQMRAALAANKELINFYWQLGRDLLEKQRTFKWGDQFLEQFSNDMRHEFPEMQGFSITNLKRMRLFAKEYPDFTIGAQAVHQLPWGHVVVLLHRVTDETQRQWYAAQTIKNGWSRSILEMQIESDLYERQGTAKKKITNYH